MTIQELDNLANELLVGGQFVHHDTAGTRKGVISAIRTTEVDGNAIALFITVADLATPVGTCWQPVRVREPYHPHTFCYGTTATKIDCDNRTVTIQVAQSKIILTPRQHAATRSPP